MLPPTTDCWMPTVCLVRSAAAAAAAVVLLGVAARSTQITNNTHGSFHADDEAFFLPGIGVVCLDLEICGDRQTYWH